MKDGRHIVVTSAPQRGPARAISRTEMEKAVEAYTSGQARLISSERNVSANVYDAGDLVVKAPRPGNEFMWVAYGGTQEIASDRLDFVPRTRYYYSKETGPLIVQRKVETGSTRSVSNDIIGDIAKRATERGYGPKDLRHGNVLVGKDGRAWVVDIDMWDFPPEVHRAGTALRKEVHARVEGSKAKKRATTGGRWRTLRDGRRVYVTGTRGGAMATTWGTRPLSFEGAPKESVSPNYLLRQAMAEGTNASVEANDVLGFGYLMTGVVDDNLDPNAVDFNKELERVGHTKQFVEEMLTDPANADFFKFVDEDGDLMIDAAKKDLAGEYYTSGGRDQVGANIMFTHDKVNAGAGSGSRGGMKVFYAPYDGRPQDLQDYMRYGLGVDPLYVVTHELHHALGSGSELDVFSDAMAIATHYSLGNNLAQKSVDSQVRDLLGYGTVRATRSRSEPWKRRGILKHRAATRWLYDNFPQQLRASIIREMGGDKYAEEYWAKKEQQVRRWRTSYPEEGGRYD